MMSSSPFAARSGGSPGDCVKRAGNGGVLPFSAVVDVVVFWVRWSVAFCRLGFFTMTSKGGRSLKHNRQFGAAPTARGLLRSIGSLDRPIRQTI
jgi:hypothetical protein